MSMIIKVKRSTAAASEARTKEVELLIKGGRVRGFDYEMAKALENSNVSVFVEDTGPFGEDEGAEIISYSPDQATGVYDTGDGDTFEAADIEDLIVIDKEFGQSGCNWTSFGDNSPSSLFRDAPYYILAGDLSQASKIWETRGFI